MAKNKWSQGRGSTRRQALAGISACSIGLVGTPPGFFSRLDRNTRIVTSRGGSNHEPRGTKKVPKQWLRNERGLRSVQKKVANRLLGEGPVLGVGLSNSDTTVGDRFQSQIRVNVDDSAPNANIDRLPSKIGELGVDVPQGVAVNDIRYREVPADSAAICNGHKSPDSYPGGLAVKGKKASDDTGLGGGTGGYRMETDDGTELLLTAHHVVASGEDGCTEEDSYLDADNGDKIGPKYDSHVAHDWAVVEESTLNFDGISNDIWYDGGSTITIDSYKTHEGIADIDSTNETIHKQGKTTGYQTGEVEAHATWGGMPCLGSLDGHGVNCLIKSGHGDSGGPIWDERFGNAKVITHSTQARNVTGTSTCNEKDLYSEVRGFAAHKISSSNNYSVG